MTGVEFILLMIGIGILAGIISAAAGLASLVTYPSLLAMGLPPVTANVTSAFSTIASGYSSLFASTKELQGHQKQVKIVLPLVLVGSVLGAWLLFALPGSWFKYLVPICIGIGGVILLFPHQPKQAQATMSANSRMFGKSLVPVSYTHLTLPTICSV